MRVKTTPIRSLACGSAILTTDGILKKLHVVLSMWNDVRVKFTSFATVYAAATNVSTDSRSEQLVLCKGGIA